MHTDFLVVYPDGRDRSWADGRGPTPCDKNSVNDVNFLSTLIDKLSGQYRIDVTHVYATGMSNGGFMTRKLACDLSTKIAVVAIVVASMSDILASSCNPTKPVSVLLMQRAKDPLVPFTGGLLGKNGDRGTVLSRVETAKKWVAPDHYTRDPTIETIPEKRAMELRLNARAYSYCDGGSEVADYRVINGRHAWPGGVPYSAEFLIGKTSRNLTVSEVRWDFLQSIPVEENIAQFKPISCGSFSCQKALGLSEHCERAIDWQYCSAAALAQLFRQFPSRIRVSVMWERQACRLGSNDSWFGISSLRPLSSHPTSRSVHR